MRGLPCQVILGNCELYLALWGTELWPAKWNLPRARELAAWEQERLGSERLAWWELARPAQQRCFLPPRPVIHVTRAVEQGLVAALTAFGGYRRAR